MHQGDAIVSTASEKHGALEALKSARAMGTNYTAPDLASNRLGSYEDLYFGPHGWAVQVFDVIPLTLGFPRHRSLLGTQKTFPIF